MRLTFESPRVYLALGRAQSNSAESERVSNTGGSFDVADDAYDEQLDMTNNLFGFASTEGG